MESWELQTKWEKSFVLDEIWYMREYLIGAEFKAHHTQYYYIFAIVW